MVECRKGGLLRFVVLVACVQSFLTRDLLATTKYPIPLTCPICEGKVTGYGFASTNNFGGQDRDFCTRAGGYQPLLFLPVTCPQCLYSGYQNDFEADVDIPKTVREQILNERVLKPLVPIDKGMQSDKIPAYARYDLIAQTYQLRGQSDEILASQFLRASWAVRMEFTLPANILGEELLNKVSEWKTSQWQQDKTAGRDNRALYEVRKGRQYKEAAKSLEGESRMITALAAISILRFYGENTEAAEALSMLQPVLPSQQYLEFERFLRESIARERHLQSKAVSLFEKAVDAQDDNAKKASLTYLCGELHRRLENWEKARSYYGKCLEVIGRPDWLAEWAKEQNALLPD